eukprot:TRINITY_DN12080_c0_g1_i10.p1 TRINITY_DN12080_c0_g1~~TRINITY_DN12080_c0_g1_i10.p1  ORF type:complete len:739 (+),score=198.54 TRINITY_DN12080_c0_g1_i10:33-2219(+)
MYKQWTLIYSELVKLCHVERELRNENQRLQAQEKERSYAISDLIRKHESEIESVEALHAAQLQRDAETRQSLERRLIEAITSAECAREHNLEQQELIDELKRNQEVEELRVAELESQLDNLKDQFAEKISTQSATLANLEMAQTELKHLKAEHIETLEAAQLIRECNRQLEASIMDIENKASTLRRSQMEAFESEVTLQRSQPGTSQAIPEVRALEEANTQLGDQLKEVQAALERKTNEVDEMAEKFSTLKTELEKWIGESSTFIEDKAALLSQLHALQAELDQSQSKSQKAELLAATLQKQLTQLEQQHKTAVSQLDMQVQSEQEKLETVTSKLENLHAEVASKNVLLDDLHRDIQVKDEQIVELEASNEAVKSERDELLTSNATLRNNLKQKTAKAEQLEGAVKEAGKSGKDASRWLKKYQAKVEAVRRLNDTVVELESENDQVRSAFQQQKAASMRSMQRLEILEHKLHSEIERRKTAERKMMDAHCLLKEERKKAASSKKRSSSKLPSEQLEMRASTGLDGIPSFPGRKKAPRRRALQRKLIASTNEQPEQTGTADIDVVDKAQQAGTGQEEMTSGVVERGEPSPKRTPVQPIDVNGSVEAPASPALSQPALQQTKKQSPQSEEIVDSQIEGILADQGPADSLKAKSAPEMEIEADERSATSIAQPIASPILVIDPRDRPEGAPQPDEYFPTGEGQADFSFKEFFDSSIKADRAYQEQLSQSQT